MSQGNIVHKLTLAIMDLVAGYEERNSLFIHIFNICSQIQATIAPLIVADSQSQSLNSNTENCLHSLAPILRLTYNHLEMWTHRRSHGLISLYNPWLLAHKLKVHKRQLLEQYIMLVASLQVVDRIMGYNFVSPAVSVYSFQNHNELRHKKTNDHVILFPNSEAKTFWNHYFKGQPDSVEASRFRLALSQWLGKEIDDNSYRRLLLRLDHDHENIVRFSAFYGLVKHGKMADIINSYLSDPRLPLLVWIDESVEENSPRVFEAITHGVTVVQLASIHSAKVWLSANHSFLLHNDDPASIRFIANQTSDEIDSQGKPFVNHNAGQDILKYIRQQGIYSAPVLILSSPKDIQSTAYVMHDRMAGSTLSTSPVYGAYVSALGSRKRDDDGWKRFNAV